MDLADLLEWNSKIILTLSKKIRQTGFKFGLRFGDIWFNLVYRDVKSSLWQAKPLVACVILDNSTVVDRGRDVSGKCLRCDS